MNTQTAPEQSEDLMVHYDPLSFSTQEHPYDTYRQLRDHAPVYFNESRNLWVVSRYEDVKACLANHERLINAFGNDIDGTHDAYGVGMLVCQDPPRHTVLRNAIRKSFAGREIAAMQEGIRAHARELLASFRRQGGGDFTEDVTLPLVFDVSMRLVGLPREDASFHIDHLKRAMVRTVGKFGVPNDAVAANAESEEHLAEFVARRRAELAAGEQAGVDAISQILLSVERGEVFEEEVVGLAHLVLSASSDAPAALVSNCVAVLDRFPALQQHLVEHPEKIGNFVEEVLRWESPAQNISRQSSAEVTLPGGTIPPDSRVMLLLASANRDERVYEDAADFDVDRVFTDDNKILTFGEGIHSCMGAPLARLTAEAMVEELVEHLRDGVRLRVVGMPDRWVKQMVRGFSHQPVELSSGPVEELIGAKEHHQTKLNLTADKTEFETGVRVDHKEVAADGVVALELAGLDGEDLPAWSAGAHIDLIIDDVPTRQYSLCGDPADLSTYRIGILREPESRGTSRYIHDDLSVGDVVRIRGPRNHFPLESSPRYLFIAGGIGITPILPMLRAADADGADWRLVYGGRTGGSMAFSDELVGYGDKVSLLPEEEFGLLPLDELLGEPRPETHVYCCGPAPLLDAVERQCESWPSDALHIERFAAKPLAEPVLKEPFEVYLAESDVTVTVPLEMSILEAARDAGITALSSCEEGTCGTCETPVVDGVPDHRDSVLGPDARASNETMMICISRSCTKRLVLDL